MEPYTPIREATLKPNANVMSPLRRSLAITSTPLVVSEQVNDDENERNRRRTQAEIVRRVTTPNSSVVEYTQTVQEHFDTCLKLFAQNKINVKNVWNLRIIDYLRVALEAKGDLSDRLKLAGTSLEVSSKIYALRVDDLYNDVMKLADRLACIRVREQNEGAEPEGAVNDENEDEEHENQARKSGDKQRKRRKKTKCVNVVPDEQINGTFARTDTAYKRNFVRGESFEVPTNLVLPVAYGTYATLVPCRGSTEKLWHVEPSKINNGRKLIKYKIPLVNLKKYKAICPSFANFIPNQLENHDLSQQLNDSLFDKVVYDDEGIPIPEVDAAPANDIHSDSEQCDHNDGNTEIVQVLDMRPEPGQGTDLEYSFRPVAPVIDERFGIVGAWAGPSHWKIKHLRKPRSSTGTERQSAARERRLIVPIDLDAERPPTPPLMPLEQKATKTKKSNYIDRTKLPEDAEIHKIIVEELMLKSGTFIEPGKFWSSRHTVGSDANVSQTINSKVVYEYENEEDVNYCRRIPDERPGWVDVQDCPDEIGDQHNSNVDLGDGVGDGDADGCATVPDDSDNMDEELAKAITEQDVLAPEFVVPQYNLAYATRSKKVDMKALKRTIWNQIEKDCETNEGIAFTELLNALPHVLTTKTAEDISDPIAFVALLHLANEKILDLRCKEGFNDFTIHKA